MESPARDEMTLDADFGFEDNRAIAVAAVMRNVTSSLQRAA